MAELPSTPNKLTKRGIAQSAEAMGWQSGEDTYSRGWLYPVYDLNGAVIAQRWKAYDSSATPKYLWLDGNAQYYHVGAGLRTAITEAGGILIIANGEPAVLTFHAAERMNVLCFFGETHVPATLAADLGVLGVTTVRYYPDKDKTGLQSAVKLRATLDGSGIMFDPRVLPDELSPKGDTNDLWQLLGFDAPAFDAALDGAPVCALPAPAPIIHQRETSRSITGLDRRDEFINTVVLPEVERAEGRRKDKKFGCINPDHPDKNPSARIGKTHNGNLAYFCTCGTHSLTTVARWLNLDYLDWFREHYPNEANQWRNARRSSIVPTTPKSQKSLTQADQVQNQRYIDLPTGGDVIALQSDVGTGKTKTMIRAAQDAPSALYLAPRERLAENFSAEAAKIGVAVENYKQLSKADRRRPARSAFCVNSYSALADEAPGLPVPELLELDEIEQLIEHIYGEAGTFDDREAIDAAEALKYVIRKSRRILAMDAHLGDLALDYLKAQGRTVLYVVNDYVTERGPLTIHAQRDGALAQGEALVNAHEGVIVYACASASRAATISAALVDLLGNAADVLLLTAENGGGERQRAFFADPNAQIGQYRAVVYSPVIGTGFDITAPVRAVIGIMAAHLSAYDARQMIGRCRNPRETHVYLPRTSGTLEGSADAIAALELEKAERTIKKLTHDGVRVTLEIDNAQRDYLRWHARVMARRNGSINHLREHFVGLCAGYTIRYSKAQAPELAAKLAAIKNALDDARKALVLTVDPIDADTFRRLRDAGKADESAIAGHLRGQIESVIGVTLSPRVRDQLWTAAQRAQVRRYTDLYDQIDALRVADQQDVINGVPLPKRRHRTVRRNVVVAFLNALTDRGALLQLGKDELDAAITPVIERWSGDLRRLFGWRPDRCKSPAATARRVLESVGLKLNSDQQTVRGAKVRVYQIDRSIVKQLEKLKDQRLTLLKDQRAENATPMVNLKTALGTVSKRDGSFKIAKSPPKATAIRLPGGGAAPQEFEPRIAAQMESVSQGF